MSLLVSSSFAFAEHLLNQTSFFTCQFNNIFCFICHNSLLVKIPFLDISTKKTIYHQFICDKALVRIAYCVLRTAFNEIATLPRRWRGKLAMTSQGTELKG